MNIQKYIFPEWSEGVRQSDLPNNLAEKYKWVGKSMSEFLDRQMMRELPDSWYTGWVRYHFPLKTDRREIELHNIIADQFAEFVSNNKKASDFMVSKSDLDRIEELENAIGEEKELYNQWFRQIKDEIIEIREAKYGSIKERRSKKKTEARAGKPSTARIAKEDSAKTAEILDREFVYKKWMEEVNEKEISKSYWHIHEYMARFILDFAEEQSNTGKVTSDIVEDFLVEYGRGKRPKTMNHYNRVARYFWNFYHNLEKEAGLS
jgi:hypothetical protein